MITVEEAYELVLGEARSFGTEMVPLASTIGRVLAEDIGADRDFPPFDRVMMDGIAIRYDDYAAGCRSFTIVGVAAAGAEQQTLLGEKSTLEVMTGAPLPIGADTVIRYEDVIIENGTATIQIDTVQQAQSIHAQGRDQQQGDIILPSGHLIKAIDINVLATVGKTHVKVNKLPRIAVVSTGDELVAVADTPLPHQIRRSNAAMICARLSEYGIVANDYHLADDADSMRERLADVLASHDAVLLSGGVSKGKYDYLPEVLESLGVKMLFHRVRQRPGKPFWFGKSERTTVFAFPGNPVSTLACFHKYFIPWLRESVGLPMQQVFARLAEDVTFAADLHYYAQAQVTFDENGLSAKVSRGNGSGDIVHPTRMDGFIELPRGREHYHSGESYPLIPFYPILQ